MTPDDIREQAIAAESQDLANAAAAQQLIDNDFVRGVLNDMESAALNELIAAKDDDTRRTAQAKVIAVRAFAVKLKAATDDGKMAAHRRNTREKADAAAPRRAQPRK